MAKDIADLVSKSLGHKQKQKQRKNYVDLVMLIYVDFDIKFFTVYYHTVYLPYKRIFDKSEAVKTFVLWSGP